MTRPRTALVVGAAYATQGLGYAAVVTALPSFKARLGIDDTVVSLILLGTCLAAALGSIVADLIAVRWGSRQALCAGLAAQAVGIAAIACGPSFPVFLGAIVLYGVGLGAVDASSNMQGVLLQARASRPVLGRLYAAYTGAAIVGALAMSGFLASSGAVTGALLVAVVVEVTVIVLGALWFDPERAARAPHQPVTQRTTLPRRGIWVVGGLVLAAFVVDSAVSSWSTIYLADGLRATAAVAPLGYAAYQAVVLLSRLGADTSIARFGRLRAGLVAAAAGVLGCVLVAVVPTAGGAVVGFGIAGVATGVLVPIAFGAAGDLMPARSDEVIARVNLFNYGGVLVGAVLLGLVGSAGLGMAFLIPAVAILAAMPIVRAIGRTRLGTVDGTAAAD